MSAGDKGEAAIMRYVVRPLLAFLLTPVSISAVLLAVAVIRAGESYFLVQLLAITKILYICEAVLGTPMFFFFRKRNINSYSSYAIAGGAIGMVPALAIMVWCALLSTSCGFEYLGLLNFSALGALFGAVSAIVFRIILGKHMRRTAPRI